MPEIAKRGELSKKTATEMEMLRRLANLRFTDQLGGDLQLDPEQCGRVDAALVEKAKGITMGFWPELWEQDASAAMVTLREVRDMLRKFWEAEDTRSRLWYIHRVREIYRAHMIRHEAPPTYTEVKLDGRTFGSLGPEDVIEVRQVNVPLDVPLTPTSVKQLVEERLRQFLEARDGKVMLNDHEYTPAQAADEICGEFKLMYGQFDRQLNEPPPLNKFEDALFKLQQRAEEYGKSRGPGKCRYPGCVDPYFFRNGLFPHFCMEATLWFCSKKCAREENKRDKRESLSRHKDEWPSQVRRKA